MIVLGKNMSTTSIFSSDRSPHGRALYFVLAFYGTAGDVAAAKGFLSAISDSFSQLGYPPDRLSVGRDDRYGKPGGFRRTSAILHKKGFDGVHHLAIHAMLPGFRFMDDTYCDAEWTSHEPRNALVCVRADILGDFNLESWPLVLALIRCLKPEYGIGYFREHRLGPGFFALGIGMGLPPITPEGERISAWGLALDRRPWRDGLIRDVFRWSFLTKPQLQRTVGNQSLETWINNGPDRGTLQAMSKNMAIWSVPEEHMPAIRQALRDAGVIYERPRREHTNPSDAGNDYSKQ